MSRRTATTVRAAALLLTVFIAPGCVIEHAVSPRPITARPEVYPEVRLSGCVSTTQFASDDLRAQCGLRRPHHRARRYRRSHGRDVGSHARAGSLTLARTTTTVAAWPTGAAKESTVSIQNDPRLIIAHWADEATRAANDPEAAQAREHHDEDLVAAQDRAELAGAAPHLTRIQRFARRLRIRR